MQLNIKHITIYLVLFLMGVGGVNAQDIIVLKNGELIKSKVIEISLSTMEYKRFDQENGPTYTINKSEVFAIHYADGSKDLFGNVNQLSAQINRGYEKLLLDTVRHDFVEYFMKKRTVIHIGVGVFKVYAPTNEIGVSKHKAKTPFMSVDLGVGLTTNLVVGISLGSGKYTATETFGDQFKLSTTTFDISEDIKSFGVWSRYYLKTRNPGFRPYATLGLSVNSSRVQDVITTSTGGQNIIFNRGGTVVDFFPVTRIGMEFDVKGIIVHSELGYGVTLINLGIGYAF